jgi:hypothetical protein
MSKESMLRKWLLFIFLISIIIFQLEAQYNKEPWWKLIQNKTGKTSWWQSMKSDKNEVVAAAKSYKERRKINEDDSVEGLVGKNFIIKRLSFPNMLANSQVDLELNSIGALHVTPLVQTGGEKRHYDRVSSLMKMRPKASSNITLSQKGRREKESTINFDEVGASSSDRMNRPTLADRLEKEKSEQTKNKNKTIVKRFNKFFKSKKTSEETIVKEKPKTGNFVSTWLKRSVGMREKVVVKKNEAELWSDASQKFPIVYVEKEEFSLTPKMNERIEVNKVKSNNAKRKVRESAKPAVNPRANRDVMSKKVDVSKLDKPILSNAELILDHEKEKDKKKAHDIVAFLTKPIKKMFAKKEKPKMIDDKLIAINTRYIENDLDPIMENVKIPAELLKPKEDTEESIKKGLIIKHVRRFNYAETTRKPEGIVYPKKKKHFNSISELLSRQKYDRAQRQIK